MNDTVTIDRDIIAEIAFKRELIELQHQKRKLIDSITDDARYLHELLTRKDPNKIAEIRDTITQIEQKIERQKKEITDAIKKGIEIKVVIRTVLHNEAVVCEEIRKKLNNIPALIEKLDELQRKTATTMIEMREMDYK